MLPLQESERHLSVTFPMKNEMKTFVLCNCHGVLGKDTAALKSYKNVSYDSLLKYNPCVPNMSLLQKNPKLAIDVN